MHADRGQNLWERGMLKGDFRKAAHRKQGVLVSDLNGRNMENIIHLNRFIFLVDGTKLEGTKGDHLSRGVLHGFSRHFDFSKCSIVIDNGYMSQLFNKIRVLRGTATTNFN